MFTTNVFARLYDYFYLTSVYFTLFADRGAATAWVPDRAAGNRTAGKKSEAPLPEQKKPEAPNLAVPVAAEQAASLPEPQVSHASVR